MIRRLLAPPLLLVYDHPCLSPTITHTDVTGRQRAWQPEACPARAQ